MRIRAVLLIPLTCGGLMAFAGAASALQIGPVKVPRPVPPVPVPAPAVRTKPIVLPDADVNVTPNGGVTIGTTIPGSVGPVPASPDPSSVQVTGAPSGVDVTTAPDPSAAAPTTGSASAPATDASGSDAPSGPAPSDPTTSGSASGSADSASAVSGPTASSPVSDLPANQHTAVASASTASHARAKPSTDPFVGAFVGAAAAASAVPGRHGSTTSIGGSSRSATPVASAPKEVAVPDAVNAVLQHVAPGGSWTLAREAVTGRFGLWLALLAILGVVRWALTGLVRDARRRARFVSSV